jgi:hypothetical protein
MPLMSAMPKFRQFAAILLQIDCATQGESLPGSAVATASAILCAPCAGAMTWTPATPGMFF